MMMTLILIGVSILSNLLLTLYYALELKYAVAINIFSFYPVQIIEKSAIFFDIARLTIILITLKQVPKLNLKINLVKKLCLLANFFLVILYAVIVILILEEYEINENKSIFEIKSILIFNLVFSIYSNGIIIIAYLLIFYHLKKH